MAEYSPLTDREITDIAGKFYLSRKAHAENWKKYKQDRPIMAIIAAQPGAGKSATTRMIKDEMKQKGGYIHIDADVMREEIPIGDSRPSSAETQKDAGVLVNKVRALAIYDRQSIIEEGTFRNSEVLRERIEALHNLGYTIEVLAIATSSEESRLGIFQRFETQHIAKVKNPRFVSFEFHDMAMIGFDKSIQNCQALVDRIRVTNRSGQLLYDSSLLRNEQKSAYEAILEGRKMSSEKLYEIASSWQEVKKLAVKRNTSKEYLKEIDAQITHIDNLYRDRRLAKTRERGKDEGLGF